jgi:ACR3 family arsenite efflux pump ArsB
MESEEKPDPANVHYIKRRAGKLRVSRTRLVLALLLIVAIPVFIGLANRAVHENADAIRQSFGR